MSYSLLIIDMQQASLDRPAPLFDAVGLVQRINSLAQRVREASGQVIFVRFTGPRGSPYHPEHDGWQLVPGLEVERDDLQVRKPGSDAFGSTDLEVLLGEPKGRNVIVTGCDTEFCIDSTVRSALARGYQVTVPRDGHSLVDRAHLSAEKIIEHHNAIWSTPGALGGLLTVCRCSEIPG
ncbi:MAG: isochorismatase family protein [Holophagales bacterium]|nr:isochorismatase family protein [Holophagales bacterium]